MKVVCSWCGKHIRKIRSPKSRPITHSICKKCLEWLQQNQDQSLREYLNTFDIPIFAIDLNTRIKIANTAAQKALDKPSEELEGSDGGNAMECAYARLPEGCGNTIHCKACTIRNTVTRTFETGECFENITAYQDIVSPDGVQRVKYLISTEKINDMVLLRIQR